VGGFTASRVVLLHTSSRPRDGRETLTGENQPSPGLLLRRSTRVELEVVARPSMYGESLAISLSECG
jgi:hypothetical protein